MPLFYLFHHHASTQSSTYINIPRRPDHHPSIAIARGERRVYQGDGSLMKEKKSEWMVFLVGSTTIIKVHFHHYLTAKFSYVYIRIRAYGKYWNGASQNNQNISAMKHFGTSEQQLHVEVHPQEMLHPQFRKSTVKSAGDSFDLCVGMCSFNDRIGAALRPALLRRTQ